MGLRSSVCVWCVFTLCSGGMFADQTDARCPTRAPVPGQIFTSGPETLLLALAASLMLFNLHNCSFPGIPVQFHKCDYGGICAFCNI